MFVVSEFVPLKPRSLMDRVSTFLAPRFANSKKSSSLEEVPASNQSGNAKLRIGYDHT